MHLQGHGLGTLSVVFAGSILADDGYLDFSRHGRTFFIPTCENARLRGSAISSFARFKKIVTAHELGHSIGCLLPKENTEGWGANWLMREPDAEGTDLDEKEQARLRENAAKIP